MFDLQILHAVPRKHRGSLDRAKAAETLLTVPDREASVLPFYSAHAVELLLVSSDEMSPREM